MYSPNTDHGVGPCQRLPTRRRRLGAAADQILQNIVGLTPDELVAAWDYYRDHRAEIDEDIRDNEED